ncbi:hypothetical protein TorRG33x02_253350, partial [Trema orientale]
MILVGKELYMFMKSTLRGSIAKQLQSLKEKKEPILEGIKEDPKVIPFICYIKILTLGSLIDEDMIERNRIKLSRIKLRTFKQLPQYTTYYYQYITKAGLSTDQEAIINYNRKREGSIGEEILKNWLKEKSTVSTIGEAISFVDEQMITICEQYCINRSIKYAFSSDKMNGKTHNSLCSRSLEAEEFRCRKYKKRN